MDGFENDDDLVREFIVECREHLATIENDLLAVEEGGANIDENLVNKVFRAAHSIKGGAGFFNLKVIQELAHKTENILDMVRSREMVPSPEVVNILLQAFDRLRELVNHHQESNSADISELVVSLTGLASSFLAPDQKATLHTVVKVPSPKGGSLIEVTQFDLAQAAKRGQFVYLAEIDLIHDVQRHGRTPWDLMKDLMSVGVVFECQMDISAVGTLDDEPSNTLPMEVLYATVLDPSMVGQVFEQVSPDKVHLVQKPGQPQVASATPAPAVAPAEAPVVVFTHDAPVAHPVSAPAPVAPPTAAKVAAPVTTPLSASADAASSAASGGTSSAPVDETLRVNVRVLETLMNLAGELVLGRNQLFDAINRGDIRVLRGAGQRISLITSEMQEAIMQTRMQPIGTILGKFPRVVRDLARERNKEIRLDIVGREVEMDKALVEGLSDPLTHMVRNSVDHGIEDRETRVAQGKSAEGRITLRAYHAAGQVVVEIADDGKGIDPVRIATAALSRGRITEDQAKLMSDREKMALIFLPGLSTAEKVTDVSGRGVGMDVVKTNLDRLGGKVVIESEVGKGTTFRITLPLTLAIVPSLLVSVGSERFAVPQVNVNELLRVPAAEVKNRIELVGDREVLRLRGQLMPVVRLAEVLGMERTFTDAVTGEAQPDHRQGVSDRRSPRHPLFSPDGDPPAPALDVPVARRHGDRRYHAASDLNIAVLNAGSLDFGLVVDDLHDTVEIVVRPLGEHLDSCREYAGATILGDGQVAIILDVAGIAAKASLTSLSESTRARELAQETADDHAGDRLSLMLFHNAPDETCGILLDRVSRLESIDASRIEMFGGTRAMKYRDRQLPLFALKDVARVGDLADDAERVVLVIDVGGREVGLLAAMPVDIVDTKVSVDTTHRQPGITGTCILRNRTTLLVDIDELVGVPDTPGPAAGSAMTNPAADPAAGPRVDGRAKRDVILLAEDSDFFRGQIKRLLEDAGYAVLGAPDGQAAWDLLRQHEHEVRLVVTDIEMPRMNGLELTRRIRAEQAFVAVPIIAVTTLADDEDTARGRAAGVDYYQVKLDKERLLETVRLALTRPVDSTRR